jgi:hypothetical protein
MVVMEISCSVEKNCLIGWYIDGEAAVPGWVRIDGFRRFIHTDEVPWGESDIRTRNILEMVCADALPCGITRGGERS